MTKSTVAKIAAGLVGFAFVVAVVAAPVAHAQTTADLQSQIQALLAQIAQLQGTTSGSASGHQFNVDLTVGSTGADVVALQTWLVSKGFLTMPAGVAMGSFGPLTKSAVAAWQASVGLPATGYFGPLSRAKVNSSGTVTTTPGTTPGTTGSLSGGEATLEDYELESEESSGHEGEAAVEIATAKFDVEDGDARIERIEVDFQAESTNDSVRPWDYFDNVSLWADGRKIADVDTDSRSDWDEDDDDSDHSASSADWYRLTFTGLNHVVREGDTAEITIAADIAGNIDGTDMDTQEFTVLIPDDGIRATDGEGIQQYSGDYDETVDGFGFDEEESGDLDLESNNDDPDTMTLISDEDEESDEYTVFVFDIENNDDVDTLITDMTINVSTSSGDSMTDIIDSATLVVDGDEFDGDINTVTSNTGTIDFDDMDLEIGGDETVTFELVITLKEDAPDSTLDFTIPAANVTAEGVDSGDDADVSGSVSSETHTVSAAGIQVEGDVATPQSSNGNDADVNDDGDAATFKLTFSVEALEDDVYIYNGAIDSSFSASTTGVLYKLYKGGSLLGATTTDSATLQSSAELSGNYFLVEEGDTETFTLTVTLAPDTTNPASFFAELDTIRFDNETASGTFDDTSFVLPDDSEFETNVVVVE